MERYANKNLILYTANQTGHHPSQIPSPRARLKGVNVNKPKKLEFFLNPVCLIKAQKSGKHGRLGWSTQWFGQDQFHRFHKLRNILKELSTNEAWLPSPAHPGISYKYSVNRHLDLEVYWAYPDCPVRFRVGYNNTQESWETCWLVHILHLWDYVHLQ